MSNRDNVTTEYRVMYDYLGSWSRSKMIFMDYESAYDYAMELAQTHGHCKVVKVVTQTTEICSVFDNQDGCGWSREKSERKVNEMMEDYND